MEKREKHIQNLIYFAMSDKDFDVSEKDFIRQVGNRLGLSDEKLNSLIESAKGASLELPNNEVQRYILFDDILNLIAADKKITDAEEQEAMKLASVLGFPENMVHGVLLKIKRHIEQGYNANQLSNSIKNSVFTLTYNKASHDKYSI